LDQCQGPSFFVGIPLSGGLSKAKNGKFHFSLKAANGEIIATRGGQKP
jgi:hypothetical protein